MPLSKEQKKIVIKKHKTTSVPEFAKKFKIDAQIIVSYCKRYKLKCKRFDRRIIISQSDIDIINKNINTLKKNQIVKLCKASNYVISNWAKNNGIEWKTLTPALTAEEEKIILSNLNLKTKEIVKILAMSNTKIDYDKVYSFHIKNKPIEKQTSSETNKILFDINSFNPDLVGNSKCISQ